MGRQQDSAGRRTSFNVRAGLRTEPGTPERIARAAPDRVLAGRSPPWAGFGIPATWTGAAVVGEGALFQARDARGEHCTVTPAGPVIAQVRAHPRCRSARDHPGSDPARGRENRFLPGAERGHPGRLEPSPAHRGHRRESDRVQHRTLQHLLQQVQRLLGRRHGGLPERREDKEWCADFAAWAWRKAGAHFTYRYGPGEINGAAGSFYEWGVANDEWHPATSGYVASPGDVAVYGLSLGAHPSAVHVAIVTDDPSGYRARTW